MREIFTEDEWIIDGNYNRTIEMRLRECDTVFLFDLPTEVCLAGAIERLGKGRYDMPWIATELDPKFEKEILKFRESKLPEIYSLLEKHGQNKEIMVFKSRNNADDFINNSKKKYEFD